MKRLVLLTLLVASTSVYSECFMRSSITLSKQQVNSGPVDIQKIIVPDARGAKCVLRYRIHVKNDWQTVEGIGYGVDGGQACAQALDLRRGAVLEEVAPRSVRADSQMVCSDLTDIRVHPVRIGDIIFESETDLHTIPSERQYFWYKRSRCRMFVERDARSQNLTLYQGVICAVNSYPDSKWQVVDKY